MLGLADRRAALRLLVLLLPALLWLGACSEEEHTATNSTNARATADLQALADAAATSSGLTGFTTPDATTAPDIGDKLSDDLDQITGQVEEQNGYTAYGAPIALSPATAARLASAWARDRLAPLARGAAPLATVTVPFTGSATCDNGGTASATGTLEITTPDNPLSTTGTIVADLQDFDLTITNCNFTGATYTVWGAARVNDYTSLDYTLTSVTETHYESTLDQYIDGGLALTDGTTHYNFIFAWSLTGTFTANSDNLTGNVVFTAVNLVALVQVDNIRCEVTIADTSLLQDNAEIPWACSRGL